MDQLIPYVSILAQVSIPGSIAIVFYFLWRSKVLEVIALKIQGKKDASDNDYNQVNVSTNGKRLQKLEEFQLNAETNHWHEIADIQEWRKIVDQRITKMAEDIAFIRGRLE